MTTLTTLPVEEQQARLLDIVRTSLAAARSQGASQAEASASAGSGLSVTVRKQAVETLEHHRDQGLAVTVFFGHRKGSASTSDLRPAAVQETVQKACALARYGAEDAAAGLADPELLATEFPDLQLYFPWSVSVEEGIEIAARCEGAALAADGRISNSEGATLDTHAGCRVYGNTHGFLAGTRDTQHSLSCAVVAGEGGAMQRDYDYTSARNPVRLADAEEVGRRAAEATVRRLDARKLGTRVTPVIFPARVARSLFGHAVAALRGAALYRRASFLLDSLGKPVFAPHVSILENPFLPEAAASAAFDDEGVATRKRELFAGGLLQGYLLGSYYGRKLGLQSTGNAGGVHNLLVSHGDNSFDQLLREMGTGFVVTELMGQGVNPVTGDYSRGAAGYWVENGQFAFPVHEVTLGGNLLEMYAGISAIANDVDIRGGIRTGSVLVERMTLAGQ